MDEVFQMIEKKIKASGFTREISGEQVYMDVNAQIDGKENGSYVLMSKFEEDVTFEYQIEVLDEEFDLHILNIKAPEGEFRIDFDE